MTSEVVPDEAIGPRIGNQTVLDADRPHAAADRPVARTPARADTRKGFRRHISFEVVLWCAVTGLITFSVVGVVLAMLGWFHPIPVIGGTLAISVALLKWLLPTVRADAAPVRPHWLLTAGVLGLAIVSGLWNGAHHGEHLIAERDPGVYIATGLWLGEHGNLRVGIPVGPFDTAPGVRQSGIGFSLNEVDSLDAQFPHLNATFLAVGSWLGNMKIFLVPQVLMSAALVMLYALGVRLGRPYGGAAGALALAVTYPFVYVARDAYSEPVALLLLLSGLWALTFVRSGGVRAGLIAGALLGATCMARIDGYIPLMPIAGVIAIEWQLARRRRDAARAAGHVATIVALTATAALGAYDVWAFSRAYYDSNLGPRITTMVGGILAAALFGLLAGRYLFRWDASGETPLKVVRWGFGVIAAAVAGFLVWARFVRPDFAGLDHAMGAEGRVVDLLPWAKTLSYLWLEWYLGPLLVAVGFASLIWMTGHGLLSRDRLWLPTAGVGFATTLLYLYAPSITPDQPWAIRRFVAVSIPLLLLATGMALETLARRRPPWTLLGAGVIGVVLLVAPVRTTLVLDDTAPGASLAGRFNQICTFAHEEPSAILVTPGQALGYTIPKSLQAWCGVPVAGAIDSVTRGEILELSMLWRVEGRRLLLLSTSPEGLVGVGGSNVMPVPGPVLTGPQPSVEHVPSRMVPDKRLAQADDGVVPLFLVEVGGGGSSDGSGRDIPAPPGS
ncbi:MAG TPA: hypothetical protein VFN21_09790 [Acidimicrobiales bacterium]|nr:hypothetical protein [Acidimicrobiales bacterium]